MRPSSAELLEFVPGSWDYPGPVTEGDLALARAAVQYQLITPEQLAAARAECDSKGQPLARVLLEMELITVEQLASFEQFQKQQQSVPAAPAAPAPAPSAPPAPAAPVSDDLAPPPPAAPAAHAPVAVPPPTPVESDPAVDSHLAQMLAQAAQWSASDVHIHGGAKLKMRIAGGLRDVGQESLDDATTTRMLMSILDAAQRAEFEEKGELDLAYTLPSVARFRVNIYKQQRGVSGIFRLVPIQAPTLAQLGLPEDFSRFVEYHQGLVLLTGPSGCGKSATLAALVNLINEQRTDHVLCIEDPIETLHPSRVATVNQRQVGPHTKSFARALRAALREDPDVLAIGELRDLETVSLALSAAETGHLVLATLHTESAIRTINRLIGVFPPNQQSQIRTMISESLRVIVSQRLATTVDQQRRVPAIEVLLVNKAISNLIREGRTFQIQDAIQIGSAAGMCLLDQSLTKLLEAGTITREEALRHANDPKRIGGGQ